MEKEKEQEKKEERGGGEGAVASCYSDKVMDVYLLSLIKILNSLLEADFQTSISFLLKLVF